MSLDTTLFAPSAVNILQNTTYVRACVRMHVCVCVCVCCTRTGPRRSSEVSYHIHSIIVPRCFNIPVSFQLSAFARQRNCTTLLTIITDPDTHASILSANVSPLPRNDFPLFARITSLPDPVSLVFCSRNKGRGTGTRGGGKEEIKKKREILNKREIEHGTTECARARFLRG